MKPYKQSLTHSCLIASLLMVLRDKKCTKFGEKEEQQLALQGSKRIYPFYVVGVPIEIAKKYKCRINVVADNKFFTKALSRSFTKKTGVSVKFSKINTDFIKNALVDGPVVCHIDDNALGDYSHASHFIVIEKAGESFFGIIDPWTGARKKISSKTLERAIGDLRTHVKMCPLLLSVV